MWILKYLVCLMYGHGFIDITWKGSSYRYCLQCGRVQFEDAARERVLHKSIVQEHD